MRRFLVVLAAVVFAGVAPSGPAGAAGGGGGGGDLGGAGGGVDRASLDRKIAARRFERAKQHIEEAKAAEAKLEAATTDKERKKLEEEIHDQYDDARDELEAVVKKQPESYPAHSELGFTLRKLGRFDDSLKAYDRALELKPSYAPAIEYRGEACLELGRLDDARGAWEKLSKSEPELADQLLGKMQRWLARQHSGSPTVDPNALSEFERWLAEHKISDLPPGFVRSASAGW